MTALTHKRAKVNGVNLHYVIAGNGRWSSACTDGRRTIASSCR